MFRHLVAGAAGIAVISALTVAPAEAAAFQVTLTSNSSKADVNKTFRLSGKVTGSGSGLKKIIVQRKIGSAAWKDYSTITTRKTGTYAKVFTMKSVGAKQFRVLVPKTSKLTTGKSNTKTVTGYTWLNLTKQHVETVVGNGTGGNDDIASGSPATAKVAGKKYPDSFRLVIRPGSSSDLGIFVLSNLDNRCDRVTFGYGLDDASADNADPQSVISLGGSAIGSAATDTYTPNNAVATAALTKIDKKVSAGTKILQFGWARRTGAEKAVVAFTTPRVHCSSSSLPDSRFAEQLPGPSAG